jgi:integrase
LPWKDAPAFIAELRKRQALAAKCLEFLILTAGRSGEVLGATWGEIDLTKELWTIPAARMKAGAEHVVPLSGAAVQLLEEVRCNDPTPTAPVFAIKGVARSNMAMTILLRRMGRRDITVRACVGPQAIVRFAPLSAVEDRLCSARKPTAPAQQLSQRGRANSPRLGLFG